MRVIIQSKTHSTNNSHKLVVIPPVSFNCNAIYLTSVSIPYTFYNVRETNNELIVNGVKKYITPKNYNSIQLAQALEELLPALTTVAFDRQKLKYLISNTGPILTLKFTTSYKLFGFNQYTEAFNVNEYRESDYVGDINDGIHSLILRSNFATPFSTLFNESFGSQIIARIPIENTYGGMMINYTDINNNRPIVKNITVSHFDIELLDDDLNPVNLNGTDFQVELFLDLKQEITQKQLTKIKQ